MKNINKVLLVVAALAIIGIGLTFWSNCNYRAENNRLKAQTQAYVLRDEQSQGRYMAAVKRISWLEVQSEAARKRISELQQRIIVLAEASAVAPEVVYVEIPGEQIEGPEPPDDFTGTWEAETDEWYAQFRIPPPLFDVTIKAFEAGIEVAVTEEGVIYVSSLDPRLHIVDVRGIQRITRPPQWSVEAFGGFPKVSLGVSLGRQIWGGLWALAGVQSDLGSEVGGFAGLRFEW